MPLLDHFHPPLSRRRHWEGLHAAWANAFCRQWWEALAIGDRLPTLPLWIGRDLAFPFDLELTYGAACAALRIG